MGISANTHQSINNTLKSTGFTIVELLIVIVVIAILAAISVVAYTWIQERARVAAAKVELKNLDNASKIFNLDNGSYPDDAYDYAYALVEAGLWSSTRTPAHTFGVCSTGETISYFTSAGGFGAGDKEIPYINSETGQSNVLWSESLPGTSTLQKICGALGFTGSYSMTWAHNIPESYMPSAS